MKTIKKITFLSVLISTLLFANSGFADDHNKRYNEDCNYKKGCESKTKCGGDEYKKYKKCAKKSGKYHKGSKGRFFIGAVYALDLSNDQESKIDTFMKEFHEKRSKSHELFKDGEFDKQSYIDARMKRKENIIKAKADLIENIYSVLDDKQKEKLKNELESFEQKRR